MRKRTAARELALKVLYQLDVRNDVDTAPEDVELREFLASSTDDPEIREYATWIVDGVVGAREEIDGHIERTATHWKLGRIAALDRCILRLALFELLRSTEIPPKVAINEAIDLAKKYSTERSGTFVNGILDRIYNDLSAS